MKQHPALLFRMFDTPLMIAPAKLQVILHLFRHEMAEMRLSGIVVAEGEIPPEYMAVRKDPFAGQPEGSNIAVLEVMGSLVHRARGMDAESGIASYESIGNQLKALRANPKVGGILLRIDSPGGEVSGAYELAKTVRETSQAKPVWSVIDGMGLSAGYLIASQTRRVLLATRASVGSIGIVMIHLDQSAADEKHGLKFSVMKRGARKDDFNPHAPLSDDARGFADALLDREYELFVEHVASARHLSEKKVRETEAGIYFDDDAIALGLADAESGMDEALGEMQDSLRAPSPVSVSVKAKGGMPVADPIPDPVPVAAPQAPNPSPPQPAAITAADYEEINSLCMIARKPHLLSQFISERKTVAQVREMLMKADVSEDAESEVLSAFGPKHGLAESLVSVKPRRSLASLMRERLGLKEAS